MSATQKKLEELAKLNEKIEKNGGITTNKEIKKIFELKKELKEKEWLIMKIERGMCANKKVRREIAIKDCINCYVKESKEGSERCICVESYVANKLFVDGNGGATNYITGAFDSVEEAEEWVKDRIREVKKELEGFKGLREQNEKLQSNETITIVP